MNGFRVSTRADDHRPSSDSPPGKMLPAESQCAPLWPWVFVCAAAALCIDLGNFHRQQNADSIVPVLSSLYRWTPFFWGQNRLGQLLPLLATPFENPLTNMLVQAGLGIFSGVFALFLLTRYLQRDVHWPATGAMLVTLFLLLAPRSFQFNLLSSCQPYGASLALALMGLILLEVDRTTHYGRMRIAAAWVLMALAHWVNPTSAWVLIPLVVFRYILGRQVEWSVCVASVSALAGTSLLSMGASLVVRKFYLFPEDTATSFALADPRLWPTTWWQLAEGTGVAAGWLVPALLAITCVANLGARRAGEAPSFQRWSQFLPALLAALAYLAVTGSLTHVQLSGRHHKYMTPAFAMLAAALACTFWAPFWSRLCGSSGPVRRMCGLFKYALPAAVLGAATFQYGVPSMTTVRRDIDIGCGRFSDDIRSAGCTHLVGSYWKVWPAMFHANLVAFERGESSRVWGEVLRATVIRDRWDDIPVERMTLALLTDGSEEDVEAGIFDTTVFDLDGMSRRRQDEIEVLSPPDVFLVWAKGFRPPWIGQTERLAQPAAELWICNRTEASREISLDLRVQRERKEVFALSISGDTFSDHLDVREGPVDWQRRLVVPPGRSLVRFRCEEPAFHAARRTGRIYYRIAGPHLSPVLNTADSRPGASLGN